MSPIFDAARLPELTAYLGIFASAPVLAVSFALYVLAMTFALTGALISYYLGVSLSRLAVVLTGLALWVLWRWLRERVEWPGRVRRLHRLPVRESTRQRFGAKAVHLAKAARAGLPVPPGFAFAVSAKELTSERTAPRLAAAISRRMRGRRIVIRSSFAAEDAAQGRAHAGVFESVVNIPADDRDAVETSLRKVLASADGARRVVYENLATPGNTSRHADGFAVIAQTYVDEAYGGFARSRGEGARRAERLIEVERGARVFQTHSVIDGARRVLIGSARAIPRHLPERVLSLMQQAERAFGGPVEIEWSWARKGDAPTPRVWVHQVRVLPEGGERVLFRAPGLGEAAALTPLSADVLFAGDIAKRAAGPLASLGLVDTDEFAVRREEGLFVDLDSWLAAGKKLASPRNALRVLRMKAPTMPPYDAEPIGISPGATSAPDNARETFGALVARLHGAIADQQTHRVRATVARSLLVALDGAKSGDAAWDDALALGDAHPMIRLGRRVGEMSTEQAAAQFAYLTREESELAAPRADEDAAILEAFRWKPLPPNASPHLGEGAQSAPVDADALEDPADAALPLATFAYRQRDATLPWLVWTAKYLARAARDASLQAELAHLEILRINHSLRRSALALATHLDLGDDVFFWRLDEILGREDAPDDAEIRRRRDEYLARRDRPAPALLVERDGALVPVARSTSDDTLGNNEARGVGAGEGTIEGVLFDPSSARSGAPIPPDAIVLIDDTDIRHLAAVGLKRPILARSGGVLSHLAATAREAGTPLFILDADTPSAAPGRRVSLDFDRGVVRFD